MSATLTPKKARNTTIELFRIVCMLLVIAHHCVIHGGAYTMDNGINKWISMVILPAGKICFDSFIAISVWYTVDSKFKAQRFVKIWLEILFYNLVFTALTVQLGAGYTTPISVYNWIGNFFPMLGNSHGFAASYAMYYLLVPFLAMLAHQLTKRQTKIFIGLLFLIQVFSSIIGRTIYYYQPMPSEVLLFVLFYYVALYLKRWPGKLQTNKPLLALIVVCIWAFITISWVGNALFPDSRLYPYFIDITGNESSLTNIVAGFCLFLLVKDIKMPCIPQINAVASTTFGVLLYHDHNFFRPVVWDRFVQAPTWYYVSPVKFVLHILFAVLCIFVVGMIIDFIRQFLERQVFRMGFIQIFCQKVDCVFQKNDSL